MNSFTDDVDSNEGRHGQQGVKVLFSGQYDMPVHNIRPEAEMIIGLKLRGVDVEVMTNADCRYAQRMREAGITVHDYVPARKFSLHASRIIRTVLRAGQHDAIHLFNNKAIVNGIFASLGLPVAVVTYRGQTGNISRFDHTCYLTPLSPRVDKIVCVSDTVRHSLATEIRHPDKLRTIYKGHDISWYRDVAPIGRQTLGIPADAFIVGCVANNRPRKGVPVLIAASNLVPRHHAIHFVLVGEGMDFECLGRLTGASTHADRFHFLGHREDVLSIIATCDITVLPAIKREGLPKTVIESMALGVTPIVTATGGSPELVDEDSGIVAPPGDPKSLAEAILALRENANELRRMGEHARHRIATDFRLEDSINQHYDLYEELQRSRQSK